MYWGHRWYRLSSLRAQSHSGFYTFIKAFWCIVLAMSLLPKVYIDGQAGTTGLRIRDWLVQRQDIELLSISESLRKDKVARRELMLSADVSILCLPDDAAKEAAGWLKAEKARLIDASSAHRVAEAWVYGLPELCKEQRTRIQNAQFVSNPGCYASSFILLLRPLLDAGVIAPEAAISSHALSGYSGGGRSLIDKWQAADGGLVALPYEAPYALARKHKHIPEMMHYTGLRLEPQFLPAVGPFFCGMRVQVPLHAALLEVGWTAGRIHELLSSRYETESFVRVLPLRLEADLSENSFNPEACNFSNRIELSVVAHPSGHVLLVAILDNLGKGASGMAIQNLNLMLGLAENAGLPS